MDEFVNNAPAHILVVVLSNFDPYELRQLALVCRRLHDVAHAYTGSPEYADRLVAFYRLRAIETLRGSHARCGSEPAALAARATAHADAALGALVPPAVTHCRAARTLCAIAAGLRPGKGECYAAAYGARAMAEIARADRWHNGIVAATLAPILQSAKARAHRTADDSSAPVRARVSAAKLVVEISQVRAILARRAAADIASDPGRALYVPIVCFMLLDQFGSDHIGAVSKAIYNHSELFSISERLLQFECGGALATDADLAELAALFIGAAAPTGP